MCLCARTHLRWCNLDITLRGEVHSVQRAKFRRWLELDQLRENISKAVDVVDLSNQIGTYLSTALDFTFLFDELTWEEASILFAAATIVNNEFVHLPYMRYPKRKKDEPVPYDYEDRSFYQYAHTLAKEYGWTLDYIAMLDVDDALRMLQESMIEYYHRREWEWDLSERAVGYDEATKKAKHNKYPLPDWMLPMPTEPKVYRIPMSLLPVGNVISYRNAEPNQSSSTG